MKFTHMLVVCLLAASAPAALAQEWEFGGGVGGAFNLNNTVNRPTETATASIRPGYSLGVWLDNNSGNRWGGEIGYAFQSGQFRLSQGSTNAPFSGQTHLLRYDFQYHLRDKGSPVRPYVAFGAGIKVFRGTGEEQLTQPLSRFALLTKTQQYTGMGSVAAGIKFKLNSNWQARVEVHDYITPYPKNVVTPNLGSSISGWLNNFVPTFGLSWTK